LEFGGSYEATAQALSVHRSTLRYRLQRIGELSGHDLSLPDVRFNLQLAARAWQSLRALRPSSSQPRTVSREAGGRPDIPPG
jgi:hypothetical protein